MRKFVTTTQFINEGGLRSPEPNNGPILTDATGYIPASRYIEQMIEAGVLLERQRASQTEGFYEYTDKADIDDVTVDPTKLKHFDNVDAQILEQNLVYKFDALQGQVTDIIVEKSTPKDAEPTEAAPEK